jgi:AcrR family transcriptional regulator
MALRFAEAGRDLREDCLTEAASIIAERGLEVLSLREVARRLGVSHQAPYKHFESRDHILAELTIRAPRSFAAKLEAREHHEDHFADLEAVGRAYFE